MACACIHLYAPPSPPNFGHKPFLAPTKSNPMLTQTPPTPTAPPPPPFTRGRPRPRGSPAAPRQCRPPRRPGAAAPGTSAPRARRRPARRRSPAALARFLLAFCHRESRLTVFVWFKHKDRVSQPREVLGLPFCSFVFSLVVLVLTLFGLTHCCCLV